jgi:hypothetical protein
MPGPAQRRLRQALAALQPDSQPAAGTATPTTDLAPGLRLLTRDQLAHFIADGVLILQPTELPPALHASLYEKLGYVAPGSGAQPGSQRPSWEDLPEVDALCGSPTVRGALTSLLGREYAQHPHRHMHHPAWGEPAAAVDQPFHKDGNHVPLRDHRPRHVMAMYYPTDTTLAMGPTAVVPGSQYLECNKQDWSQLHAGAEPALADATAHAAWAARVAAETRRLSFGTPAERDTVLDAMGAAIDAGGEIIYMPPCLFCVKEHQRPIRARTGAHTHDFTLRGQARRSAARSSRSWCRRAPSR